MDVTSYQSTTFFLPATFLSLWSILYSDIVLDAVYQPGKQVEIIQGQLGWMVRMVSPTPATSESSRGTGRRDAWRHASDWGRPIRGLASRVTRTRVSEARGPMGGGDPRLGGRARRREASDGRMCGTERCTAAPLHHLTDTRCWPTDACLKGSLNSQRFNKYGALCQ